MGAPAWEYRVHSVGGVLRHPKPDQLTELLNEAAAEGWELTHMVPKENSNALWLVLRRVSTPSTRRKAGWEWTP